MAVFTPSFVQVLLQSSVLMWTLTLTWAKAEYPTVFCSLINLYFPINGSRWQPFLYFSLKQKVAVFMICGNRLAFVLCPLGALSLSCLGLSDKLEILKCFADVQTVLLGKKHLFTSFHRKCVKMHPHVWKLAPFFIVLKLDGFWVS